MILKLFQNHDPFKLETNQDHLLPFQTILKDNPKGRISYLLNYSNIDTQQLL